MSKPQVRIGHIYGLKTCKGIVPLQLAEEPVSKTSLQITRICDGFLQQEYTEADILSIIERKERFFMEMPLHILKPRNKLYKTFIAFDRPGTLPKAVKLPLFQRGYIVLNDGTVKWYKKRRGNAVRIFVDSLTPDFLELSPDNFWSFPDLCDFIESGKKISEYM